MPRLLTHQLQPQHEDFVPLARGFDLDHQPVDRLDALLVGLRWLAEAGCFHDAGSLAQSHGLAATGILQPRLGGR